MPRPLSITTCIVAADALVDVAVEDAISIVVSVQVWPEAPSRDGKTGSTSISSLVLLVSVFFTVMES